MADIASEDNTSASALSTQEVMTHQNNGKEDLDHSPNTNKLQPTLDQKQKRFFCGEQELVVWRNALLYRYSAIQDDSVILQVTDYDSEDQVLQSPGIRWIQDTDGDLAKSTIRVFHHSSKRITITLYFRTKVNSGTLLCQGNDCVAWDKLECQRLNEFVKTFMNDRDTLQFQTSLFQTPVTFLSSCESLSLTTPKMKVLQKETVSKSNDPLLRQKQASQKSSDGPLSDADSSALSDSFPLLACEWTPSKVALFPPTPPVKTPTTTKQVSPTDRLSKRRRDRRRTLCFGPQTKTLELSSLTKCKNQVITALNEMEKNNQLFQDRVIETIEDYKTATKNDLKMIGKSCSVECQESVVRLEARCMKYENQIENMVKENQRLKSQVSQCQQDIKALKSTVRSITDKEASSGLVSEDEPPPPPPEEEKDKRSSAQQLSFVGEHQIISQHRPTEQGLGNQIPFSVTPILNKDQEPVDNQRNDNKPSASNLLQQTKELLSEASQQNQGTDRTSFDDQRQPAIDDNPVTEQQERIHRQSSAWSSGEQTSSSHRQDRLRKMSPSEILSQTTVNRRATCLLIGDSVIKGIDQRRMVSAPDIMQRICIPGATTQDVLRWLSLQLPAPNIKAMVVHIGVNDCPAGPVSERDWKELITRCEEIFPCAAISFSSVVPAKGRHNLNNTIFPTNRNLRQACDVLGISFIDHVHDFIARSGAPRLAMYHNLIHPSPKGTARLAANLKEFLRRWKETSFQASTHRGREPNLDTFRNYDVQHEYSDIARRSTVNDGFPIVPAHDENQADPTYHVGPNNDTFRNYDVQYKYSDIARHGNASDSLTTAPHGEFQVRPKYHVGPNNDPFRNYDVQYKNGDIARRSTANDSFPFTPYDPNQAHPMYHVGPNKGSTRPAHYAMWQSARDQDFRTPYPSLASLQPSLHEYPLLVPTNSPFYGQRRFPYN